MSSLFYQYLLTLILLACTCATTLATDSLGGIQNPDPLHHKNLHLLKHRAPPLDSAFDYSTLTSCNDASDCHIWQVCASCTKKTFGSVVKYCSEASERGLCGLGDETMICTCSEPDLAEIASLARAGSCATDQDCEDLLSPQFGPGTGFRCATCIKSFTPGVALSWGNYCTRPQDKNPDDGQAMFYCDPIWLDSCSCGQVRPRPALPGGTKQGTLLEPSPPSHIVGEGANSNNNNLFASGFDGTPAPSLEGGGGGGRGGGMLLQGGEKDVVGFVPMGNVGDGEVPVQADSWG